MWRTFRLRAWLWERLQLRTITVTGWDTQTFTTNVTTHLYNKCDEIYFSTIHFSRKKWQLFMQLLFIYPAVQCEDITMSYFNPDSFTMGSIFALLLNGTLNLTTNSVNHPRVDWLCAIVYSREPTLYTAASCDSEWINYYKYCVELVHTVD